MLNKEIKKSKDYKWKETMQYCSEEQSYASESSN